MEDYVNSSCRNILLGLLAIAVSFISETTIAGNMQSAREILSIRTGNGPGNIGNQFAGFPIEPYNGFAVDSDEDILLSDIIHSRILRYSSKETSSGIFYKSDKSSFLPDYLCFDNNDVLYVHNERQKTIVAILPNGEVLKTYNPQSVFGHRFADVPILSVACEGAKIRISFGIQEPKIIRPVYQDEYDNNFLLINRKTYDNEVVYFNSIRGTEQPFEKKFEDASGNEYGYPIVKEWYGKYLPLLKYSKAGRLLCTIDGLLLTKITRYRVYDYYSGRQKLGLNLKKTTGNNYLIVNWYVTPTGAIYVLLANNDHIKVLKVIDK